MGYCKTSFDKLCLCNTILEAHSRPTLEAALGIGVKAWKSNYDYDKLEGFLFLRNVFTLTTSGEPT